MNLRTEQCSGRPHEFFYHLQSRVDDAKVYQSPGSYDFKTWQKHLHRSILDAAMRSVLLSCPLVKSSYSVFHITTDY